MESLFDFSELLFCSLTNSEPLIEDIQRNEYLFNELDEYSEIIIVPLNFWICDFSEKVRLWLWEERKCTATHFTPLKSAQIVLAKIYNNNRLDIDKSHVISTTISNVQDWVNCAHEVGGWLFFPTDFIYHRFFFCLFVCLYSRSLELVVGNSWTFTDRQLIIPHSPMS